MDKKTKTIAVSVVGGLVVVGLVWAVVASVKKAPSQSPNTNDTSNLLPTSTPVSTSTAPLTAAVVKPKLVATKTAVPKPSPESVYFSLKDKFGGYRFQFSDNCGSVSPTSFVIKKGSQFMIDNRDTKPHVFTFSKQKYSLKANSYALATADVVGNIFVLCDGVQRSQVNVAQ